jgi:metal transporter CNNM
MNTCTDVIEEIISEEIVDETDQFEDNQSRRRAKRMTTTAVMRGCVSFSPFLHADADRWI